MSSSSPSSEWWLLEPVRVTPAEVSRVLTATHRVNDELILQR